MSRVNEMKINDEAESLYMSIKNNELTWEEVKDRYHKLCEMIPHDMEYNFYALDTLIKEKFPIQVESNTTRRVFKIPVGNQSPEDAKKSIKEYISGDAFMKWAMKPKEMLIPTTTAQADYHAYMKCIVDNFIEMQNDKKQNSYIDWNEKDIYWSWYSPEEISRDGKLIGRYAEYNAKIALKYLQYHTKPFDEWYKGIAEFNKIKIPVTYNDEIVGHTILSDDMTIQTITLTKEGVKIIDKVLNQPIGISSRKQENNIYGFKTIEEKIISFCTDEMIKNEKHREIIGSDYSTETKSVNLFCTRLIQYINTL